MTHEKFNTLLAELKKCTWCKGPEKLAEKWRNNSMAVVQDERITNQCELFYSSISNTNGSR